MSFLFDINLLDSNIAWKDRGRVHAETNPDNTVNIDDNTVLMDFRAYQGLDASKEINNWFQSVKSNKEYLIDGEYSLVAVLHAERELVLCRDWSGVGNIYYTVENNRAIVGTNVFEVLRERKNRAFSPYSCAEFLAFEFVSEPNTLFENIFCVPRGKMVKIDQHGRVEVRGSSSLNPQDSGPQDWSKGLRSKIISAHAKRVSDVNAIYLSGGIDSSVMAITLRRDLEIDNVLAMSFATIGAEQDETSDARSVAKQLGLQFERVEVDPNDPIDLLDLVSRTNAPYPGLLFLKATAECLKSSGHRGVNLFAGQDTRLHTPHYNAVDRVALNSLLEYPYIRRLGSIVANGVKVLAGGGRAGRGMARASMMDDLTCYVAKFFFHFHKYSPVARSSIGRELVARLEKAVAHNVNFDAGSRYVFNNIVELAWDRQYTSDIAYMSGGTRSYGNGCSMPFYDKELSDFSAAIPMDLALKMTAGRAGHGASKKMVNKYVLREAYKADLTNEMIFRDKAVCVTNHLYLNGCMKEYISSFFERPLLLEGEMGRKMELNKLFDRALKKNGSWQIDDYEEVVEVQNLLFLEAVARKYQVEF